MGKTKASEKVRYFQNGNGPVIGVTAREPICVDGLYFRDVNGDGVLSTAADWRKAPKERAEALARELSVDEKIGLLFLNSWKMGIEKNGEQVDETGLLDEDRVEKGSSIFAVVSTDGTTKMMREHHVREFILRANPKPDELADWINELNRVAEEAEHFVPVLVVSNSRNENGEVVFGMNDASGVFAAWPGTMGIAAAVKGTGDLSVIRDFADCIRREWDAVGMKKGYMYMADCMTDPRWQRTYGTFGEDPELIQEIFRRLIPGVQGSEQGVTADGVAMTVKHFPGGGARENGFDPHYRQGQWNVYQTPDSLRKYHIPGFLPAIEKKAASVMPYYAKPAKAKSAEQFDRNGNPIEWIPVGFAFNKAFIHDMLREQMGFEGYINSDSGIVQMMAWGVEELEVCERVALAVNTGVDIISGSYDLESAREAYDRGQNGYYTTGGHEVPTGYTLEQITLTEEALNRAVTRTLTERFELGLFENPYRAPEKAVEVVADQRDWEHAADIHRKSVVLLKNSGALPVKANTRVYVECFHKNAETAAKATEELKKMVASEQITLVEDYTQAETAILFVNPSSGEYFNATKGYLELDICDGKTVCDVDDEGRPAETTHSETTLANAGKIAAIAEAVHANGGKVISSINFTLAWEVGNVERYSDTLLAGFDTYPAAVLDVIFGRFAPVGKMPITLPKDDSVLKVNADGVCVSPNDVPGYDKDQYMPEEMKDENGKAYAYRDAAGNYYELGFGLNA